MAQKSIIDPVDRIEGHLRIEMEVTDGVVSDAWVSGGLFRGLELIVEGREPDDAALVAQLLDYVLCLDHRDGAGVAHGVYMFNHVPIPPSFPFRFHPW